MSSQISDADLRQKEVELLRELARLIVNLTTSNTSDVDRASLDRVMLKLRCLARIRSAEESGYPKLTEQQEKELVSNLV